MGSPIHMRNSESRIFVGSLIHSPKSLSICMGTTSVKFSSGNNIWNFWFSMHGKGGKAQKSSTSGFQNVQCNVVVCKGLTVLRSSIDDFCFGNLVEIAKKGIVDISAGARKHKLLSNKVSRGIDRFATIWSGDWSLTAQILFLNHLGTNCLEIQGKSLAL